MKCNNCELKSAIEILKCSKINSNNCNYIKKELPIYDDKTRILVLILGISLIISSLFILIFSFRDKSGTISKIISIFFPFILSFLGLMLCTLSYYIKYAKQEVIINKNTKVSFIKQSIFDIETYKNLITYIKPIYIENNLIKKNKIPACLINFIEDRVDIVQTIIYTLLSLQVNKIIVFKSVKEYRNILGYQVKPKNNIYIYPLDEYSDYELIKGSLEQKIINILDNWENCKYYYESPYAVSIKLLVQELIGEIKGNPEQYLLDIIGEFGLRNNYFIDANKSIIKRKKFLPPKEFFFQFQNENVKAKKNLEQLKIEKPVLYELLNNQIKLAFDQMTNS